MSDHNKTKAELIQELNELRKQLENTKPSQHSLYRSIVEKARVSIWAADKDKKIVLWNRGSSEIYKFSPEEALGATYWKLFVAEEEQEQSVIDYERTFQGDIQYNFPVHDLDRHKTPRSMLVHTYLVEDEKGIQYQAEIGLDITEIWQEQQQRESLLQRVRLLDQLRNTNSKILTSLQSEEIGLERVLLQIVSSTGPLFEDQVDISTAIYLINAETEKISGLYASFGSLKAELSTGRLVPEISSLVGQVQQTKNAVYHDSGTDLSTSGNLATWVTKLSIQSLALLPLVWEGKCLGVFLLVSCSLLELSEETKSILNLFAEQAVVAVVNARLIEELRSAVAEKNASFTKLQELNRQVADKEQALTRTTIARDFAHGINNLLGTVPLKIDMIKRRLQQSDNQNLDQVRSYLDSIENQITDVFRKVENLSDLQRPQMNDVNNMLDTMLSNIQTQFGGQIVIDKQFQDSLLRVNSIPINLSNALWNILSNALDAMHSKGALRVKTENITIEDKPQIRIVVIDTGEGISKEDLSKIYDPKYSTKGGEHGYGLWRTKDVIESLGGTIAAESTLGSGTTFTVILPAESNVKR